MKINRIGQPSFEFNRGDRVSWKGENVTVRGISEARKMVKIEFDQSKGHIEIYYSFIYPSIPEVEQLKSNPENLSKIVSKINSKNQPSEGWDEKYRVG